VANFSDSKAAAAFSHGVRVRTGFKLLQQFVAAF